MAQCLIRDEGALGFNDPFQDKWQGQDIFTDLLDGGGDGKGPLDGAVHLSRGTDLEAARVRDLVDRSERGMRNGGGLDSCEAVGVESPAHLRRVAGDLVLIAQASPGIGGEDANLAVLEADLPHVRLCPCLPPRRKAITEEDVILRVRRLGLGADLNDVIHDAGHGN